MNMQQKNPNSKLKISNYGSSYLQDFTKNEAPTAKTNHTTTILTKNPTI